MKVNGGTIVMGCVVYPTGGRCDRFRLRTLGQGKESEHGSLCETRRPGM